MPRNLADYVVSVLADRGVRHIFGYPGAAVVPLMEAIDGHPDVEWVLMRHEGAASLAASAMARLEDRLAVCVATSGPGATNLITGLVDAHVDRAPVLAITGMVPTWKQRRFGFQDLDQARLLGSILPRSVTCSHPDQLPGMLRDCIGRAEQDRDVVHLSLPLDVQEVEPGPEDHRFRLQSMPERVELQRLPDEAYEIVAETLAERRAVVVCVGPRARGAGSAIERLAEKLGAPIISSLDGKGIIDESHPCSLGVLGIFGAPGLEITRDILQRAEGVLAFGIDNLGPFVTDESGVQVRELYQCEPDWSSVTQRYRRTRTLCCPLDVTARELAARLSPQEQDTRLDEARRRLRSFAKPTGTAGTSTAEAGASSTRGGGFSHPGPFFARLNPRLDSETVIALDVGDNTLWGAQLLRLTHREPLLVSNQLGAMGFSLPAVVAAKLSRPDHQVIGICGDGGLQMAMGELMTAVQMELHVIVVVLRNSRLQRVAAQQEAPVGTELTNPDWVEMARACGAEAARITSDVDIDRVLDQALEDRSRPFLIDLPLATDAEAPMSTWDEDFVPLNFA